MTSPWIREPVIGNAPNPVPTRGWVSLLAPAAPERQVLAWEPQSLAAMISTRSSTGIVRARTGRPGEVLVEFAFIALVLYLLLAGILEFGRALYAAQVLQQAADSAARELSRLPLPPTGTLTGTSGVLSTNVTAKQIYDESWLIIDLNNLNGQTLQQHFASAPLLNQLLMPLMIYDTSNGQNLFRYPGQVQGNTVVIPIVQYQGGSEAVIRTIPVVEEITPDPNYSNSSYDFSNPDADYSPFNLLATFGGASTPPIQPGVIALRINYPFQAATLSAYQTVNGVQTPITTTDTGGVGPYGGADGLGRQLALTKSLRPFRRVLSAQAIFRRELFQ